MKVLGAALPFAVSPALGVGMLLRKKGDGSSSSSSPQPGASDPSAPNIKRTLG